MADLRARCFWQYSFENLDRHRCVPGSGSGKDGKAGQESRPPTPFSLGLTSHEQAQAQTHCRTNQPRNQNSKHMPSDRSGFSQSRHQNSHRPQ